MGFSRQEYWVAISYSRWSSGLKDWTWSPLCLLHWHVGSLPLAPPGKPHFPIFHPYFANPFSLLSILSPHPLLLVRIALTCTKSVGHFLTYFIYVEILTCSCIVLLTSVSTFRTIILNSLSGKLPISISWRSASEDFILYFCSEIISLFLHFSWFFCVSFYAIDKIATSPRQEGVVLCRRWNLLFSLALAVVF